MPKILLSFIIVVSSWATTTSPTELFFVLTIPSRYISHSIRIHRYNKLFHSQDLALVEDPRIQRDSSVAPGWDFWAEYHIDCENEIPFVLPWTSLFQDEIEDAEVLGGI
jgi:hypothetical protein